MKSVPNKNIDPGLVDIRRPGFNYKNIEKFAKIDLKGEGNKKKSGHFRKFFLGGGFFFLLILATGGIIIGFRIGEIKQTVSDDAKKISDNFSTSASSLKDLNPKKAEQALQDNVSRLSEIGSIVQAGKSGSVILKASAFFPILKNGIGIFGRVSEFNLDLLKVASNVADLQTNGFSYFRHNGPALIRLLSDSRTTLQKLKEEVSDIRNIASRLGETSSLFRQFEKGIGGEYIKYTGQFHTWDDALGSIIELLDTKTDRNILLMFQNPSEIRPAGGFLGSYGDLVINSGEMKELNVHDIYWPDHPKNFDLKIIPPEPIQVLSKDWGARDGNWFFDFPTSAERVMTFLEASRIYKEKNILFEGAVSLNTFVIESMLEATGPIPLPEYNLIISRDNFLEEVQREVEVGRDKKAGENPKKILAFIAPILLEKLQLLSDEAKMSLIERLKNHISHKDIMIYMRRGKLATLVSNIGIDGSAYILPSSFWGGYLAVVNANIGGGKSDVFISQSIEGRVDVGADGSSFVNLAVNRAHKGGKEKDWWFRAENKNYIQILTNPEAALISLEGAKEVKSEKPIYSADYAKDPLVEIIEKTAIYLPDMFTWTMEAFGKKVFAAWFYLPADTEKTLRLRYSIPSDPRFSLNEGRPYRFVFDRQSGVKTGLKILITAPIGYRWQESGEPTYVLERENPLSREAVDLHILKTGE